METEKSPGGGALFRRRSTRFANQSFRRLAKQSEDVGLTFTDDTFKQIDRNVFVSSQFRSKLNISKVTWKRPKQLLEENGITDVEPLLLLPQNRMGKLFDGYNLFVGYSPNSWFLAAALAIAQNRFLFEQLINIDQNQFTKNGIVKFTIWQMGIHQKIVIDDRLPSLNSEPIFTKPILMKNSTNPTSSSSISWWASMLEKAYAKLYGSYETFFNNGSLSSVLIDFSGGGMVENIEIDSSVSSENLIKLICKEHSAKSLLIMKSKDFKSSGPFPFGVVPNRYYIIRSVKKKPNVNSLKRFITSFDQSVQNTLMLITNTMVDAQKSNSRKYALQELWILDNSLPDLFDTLTICRPFHTHHREYIHQLVVRRLSTENDGSMQFRFDVVPQTSSGIIQEVEVLFNLVQKSSYIKPLGMRIYSIELNRKFSVHNYSALTLITTVDPVQSRNLIVKLSLPYGRYLLKPINPENLTQLMISLGSVHVRGLKQLVSDTPKYQLLPFMTPRYPLAVTRIQVFSVEKLEKQDRFGSANPYCIIKCDKKFVRSTVQFETRDPKWSNFSAIFYHREAIQPIMIEVWNRSMLVDYFIGIVRLVPCIRAEEDEEAKPIKEFSKNEENNDDENDEILSQQNINNDDNNSTALINVQRLPLTDKRFRSSRPGFVVLRYQTVEQLKFF